MEVGRIPDRAEPTVAEAPQSDVGLGRARIDETTRHRLGVDAGGYIEIGGRKLTVASVFPLIPEDEGKGLLRIDGLVRTNANTSIGEKVSVNKADVYPAEAVTLALIVPVGHKISFGQGVEKFVKRGLLKRPVVKGDVVIAPGIVLVAGAMPFKVMRTKPEGIVRIAERDGLRHPGGAFPRE